MRVLNFIVDHFLSISMAMALSITFLLISRRESQQKNAKKILQKAIDAKLNEPLTLHPEIDVSLCAGCGACTKVCPEGDILKMINNRAVLVGASKCVGHGECERACPTDAIKLVFGTKSRGMDIPRLTKNYETNVEGLYIAGELGGMGLIRNAIKQGVMATTHALSKLTRQTADCDVFIVGAGPAGLAAGLTAIANRKSYILIEQGGFGGTVYNFPRQKVVMSHPFELPGIGKVKFSSNKISKEELLKYWDMARKSTGLKVKEQTKFEGLTKKDDIFSIKTNQGEFTARKVILAMGVRGSPRKLGVPGEELPKVTYNLLDPEQYQGVPVAVVGGGNAGVEAAQMLADPKWGNKVHLLVRGAQFDRCNEENLKKIMMMEKRGLVRIWYNSSIVEISPEQISVKHGEDLVKVDNSFVFVFAGAELPHKFLMSLGVKIDKKFGEGLAA